MEEILKKSISIQNKLLDIKSDIFLFAFLKLEGNNSWDVVLAGKNLNPNPENFKWVTDVFKTELNDNEMATISRIVLLPSTNSFARAMTTSFEVTRDAGYMRIENPQINNVAIKEGYIIYCVSLIE